MSFDAGSTFDGGTYFNDPLATSLADHIIGVSGQDPLTLAASGYLDNVFPLRLVSDTE